jgi:cysteine desulfurase
LTTVAVDSAGLLSLAALEEALAASARPALVSVMLVNNETGVVQPVAEVAALGHRHGALVHCDASQAGGKIAIDVEALGCDLLTLSAHKLGGPPGIGALVIASYLDLAPRTYGGGQERGRRAGTENLGGIAGFGAAAGLAEDDLAIAANLGELRDGLERRIAELAGDDAMFYGDRKARVANTSSLGMAGVAAETQVIAFDLAGIAVSAGAACTSGKVTRSHVLDAMGVAAERARCAIRVSLGWGTTASDVDRFVAAWAELYRRNRGATRAA